MPLSTEVAVLLKPEAAKVMVLLLCGSSVAHGKPATNQQTKMLRLLSKRAFCAAPAPAKAKGKPKKAKESKMGNTLTADGRTGFFLGEQVPINIYKEGKDPVVKTDGDYPAWLFSQVTRLPTLTECVQIMQKDRLEGFLPSRDISQRYRKIKNLLVMRKRNAESTEL